MTHLTLVGGHKHRWKEYVLKDEHGIYFKGYRCIDCGASGYAVPKASAAGPAEPISAGVATTVGGVAPKAPNQPPPTAEEWIDHLSEEHREDDARS